MQICRTDTKTNRNIVVTTRPLRHSANIAKQRSGSHVVATLRKSGIFVAGAVILLTEKKLCHRTNSLRGRAGLALLKRIVAGGTKTPKEWLFSKQGGMQEKRGRKEATPSPNGRNLKKRINTVAQFAANEKSSRKTTSSRFRRAVRIISKTFNHFAEIAIAVNGLFNIHENPELIEKGTI
jgi:hypothetical protein